MRNQPTISFVCPATPGVTCLANLAAGLGLTSRSVSSVEEIFPLLSDTTFNTDIIGIDLEYLSNNSKADAYEIIQTLRTLLNCTVYRPTTGKPKRRETKILGMVGASTDTDVIKTYHKLIDGFLIKPGGKFTDSDAKQQISTVMAGDLSIPRCVNELIRKEKEKSRNLSGKIILTPRQQQIYTLVIDKGASNKAIGRILNISESTVKLHMTAILKKYGVRNRTQLAVFSKKNTSTTTSSSQ